MTILFILEKGVRLWEYMLFFRVLLSWFPRVDTSHPMVKFLHKGTEPVLAPIRNILPMGGLPLDLSPIIAILVIETLFQLIVKAIGTGF